MSDAADKFKIKDIGGDSAGKKYFSINYGDMPFLKACLAEMTFTALSWVGGSAGILLRRVFYRPFFRKIGSGARISENVTFRHPHKISIGASSFIGKDCLIDSKGSGNTVNIGAGAKIGDASLIYTKGGNIEIGNNFTAGSQCMIFSSKQVTIGENVTVGDRSYILSGGEYDVSSQIPFSKQDGMLNHQPTTIGANTVIGSDVTVLNGRTIGERCSIGNGSVVTKVIPSGSSATGVPASLAANVPISGLTLTTAPAHRPASLPDSRPSRGIFRTIIISLLITLTVWTYITWPLPKHLFDGITMSSRNIEKDNVRIMISGDHLQLLYRFWLFHDAVSGNARPFHNVYEFNTGDDGERFETNPYFLPWSAVYSVGHSIGKHAFGWNLTVFVSLWLGYLFTILFVRRYCTSDTMAFAVSLVALVLPYRLLTLYMGSPTGFAMAFVPMLVYGLDLAIRDGRQLGGYLAGFAVLFSFFCDAHVFFLAALITPAWGVITLLTRDGGAWKTRREFALTFKAILPAVVIGLFAVGFGYYDATLSTKDTVMSAGRSIDELNRYSPSFKGFFRYRTTALNNQVFLGYGSALLALVAIIAWARLFTRKDSSRSKLILTAITAFIIIGTAIVALGTNGPFHAAPIKVVREMIPHFDKIRQPGKLFSIMPALLALFSALTFSILFRTMASRITASLVAGLIIIISFAECAYLADATICILNKEQAAYKIAADEAKAVNEKPHVLVVPLWPGDSHESSIYEYYVSLYGIRMVNGYNPAVKLDYVTNVFKKLESGNLGILDDSQIAMLRKMGVRHVIAHEDAFPEKVSPYPVGFTLANLCANRNLELAAKDDSVWAFRILDSPANRSEPFVPTPAILMPSIKHEAENCSAEYVSRHEDAAASYGRYIRLEHPSSSVRPPKEITTFLPDQHWALRLRGNGSIIVTQPTTNNSILGHMIAVMNTNEWCWKEVQLPQIGDFDPVTLTITLHSGEVDFDCLQLMGSKWTPPQPGTTVTIPAFSFFHAGCYDEATKSVLFRKMREPEALIFYGPKLPLEKGRYRLELEYKTTAEVGTELGSINIRHRHDDDKGWVKVIAGQPAVIEFDQQENIPFYMTFLFSRNADMSVSEVRLTNTTL